MAKTKRKFTKYQLEATWVIGAIIVYLLILITYSVSLVGSILKLIFL